MNGVEDSYVAGSARPARVVGLTAKGALRFVVSFGIVSLFADMTYEGMRSIAGPFLALLGASGFIVGLIAGVGELAGYTLRLVSGRYADRSRLYWPITLAGYVVQMAAVPALALVGNWPAAAALIILERVGKATRNPARNAMLAQAGEHIGHGWAFGLHEAMDQTGALVGPLLAAGVLALRHDYHAAFAWLLIPAAITLGLVLSIRVRYPEAGQVSRPAGAADESSGLPQAFWIYSAGAALVAFGFSDYALISFHFARVGSVGASWVPVLYAFAMAAAGAGSLVFGRWFDKSGLIVLVPATLGVAVYPILVFFGGFPAALAGTVLWGLGLGVHDAIMSAAVAKMVPAHRRGRAYGVFSAIFGISWFAGSAALGALYDWSVSATVIASIVAQVAAIGPIWVAARKVARGA